MTMEALEPPRRSRGWIYLGLVMIGLAAAVHYGIVGGLKNCRWLDRLLGISGCIASHPVRDLRPLDLWRTLAVPADGKTIAYFGAEVSGDLRRTTIVVLDTETGLERTRKVVVESRGALRAVASSDGQRTALMCESRQPCIEGQYDGIIVSSLDGRRLESVTNSAGTVRDTTFPGDPELPAWAGFHAIGLPGDLVASRESGTRQVTVRRVFDGSEVLRLRDRDGLYQMTLVNTMAVSPSGRWLAILPESVTSAREKSVHIFDLKTGIQTASIPLGEKRLFLAWAGDDRLVIPRAAYTPTGYLVDATSMTLEIYAMPKLP